MEPVSAATLLLITDSSTLIPQGANLREDTSTTQSQSASSASLPAQHAFLQLSARLVTQATYSSQAKPAVPQSTADLEPFSTIKLPLAKIVPMIV